MKKTLLSIFALFAVMVSSAQDRGSNEEFIWDLKSNWFVSAGAGVEWHYLNQRSEYLDLPASIVFDLSVGKWLNPYVGLRAQYNLSFIDGKSSGTSGTHMGNSFGESTLKGVLSVLHGDLMFNASAIIGGYRPDRFYEIYPFLGYGVAMYTQSGSACYEVYPLFGIVNDFKLNDKFSLNCELRIAATKADTYSHESDHHVTPMSASVGMTYRFGKNTTVFKTTEDVYKTATSELGAMKSANNKLKRNNDDLAKENKKLKDELSATQKQLGAAKNDAKEAKADEKKKVTATPVFFDINSNKLSKREVASLKYVAATINDNPSTTYTVNGYADNATGSEKYNQRLSERRAEAVVDVLVDVYGVSKSQLKAVGNGGVDNMYDSKELNRCTIVANSK
ncbi:MAG: OmpA family protein [Rikenellaceae bacterium]